ncbi:glycine zipper 2TM domain-containing protein [Curvibacter sp. HBC61]|uniref:Glycine zipper 2TM domain-containing protein n=1 Tax=Curvibacter cyanobacteriorum TaxID=3026422 RepID=A0ABT5MTG5_9BURK|nr:glycine zipper 2TM domain-containing protein [Curvibacter sp. HBC61]MDD0837310.1 glycine zipper 2TM domain-containing protein [Curvibacter sp. HBC61]
MKTNALTSLAVHAHPPAWLDRMRHSRSLWPLVMSLGLITLALAGTLAWQYAEQRSPVNGAAVAGGGLPATAEAPLDPNSLPATGAGQVSAPPSTADSPVRAPAAPSPVVAAPVTPRTATSPSATPTPTSDHSPTHTPVSMAPVCRHCGTVEQVRAVQRNAPASGVGAVAGGVLGGLLGNQMGGGNGRTAMTVLGAVGGGVAGHAVEQNLRKVTVYETRVRMDDGQVRTFEQSTAWPVGSAVRVQGQSLLAQAPSGVAP